MTAKHPEDTAWQRVAWRRHSDGKWRPIKGAPMTPAQARELLDHPGHIFAQQRTANGTYLVWQQARRRVMRALALAALLALPAAAHSPRFTAEETAWLNRQRAIDGMKCCDETDAHVGQYVAWRIVAGRYEVQISGAWRAVPPGRVMRAEPADPTPWPGAALLFYSHPAGAEPQLWCFFPEPLT